MHSTISVPRNILRVLELSSWIGILFVFGCAANSTNVPVTSALIVSDALQNRVLIYDVPFSTGQSASRVLGQTSFSSETSGTTANTMSSPGSITMDRGGNLYVTDDANCRVLQFVPPFTDGMSATLVLGQPSLNTGVCPTIVSATSLGKSIPIGNGVFGIPAINVATDSSGDLWVADSEYHRVLEYKPPFSDGMAAVLAIGQMDLYSGSPNQGGLDPTDSTLQSPDGLAFDTTGNLWIVDHGNSRVLEFKPPFATGMAASLALGQADFTHNSPNQGASAGANTFSDPMGATFDSSGNLWVADALNNRVLEFRPPFTTNMNASVVLGQLDFHNGWAITSRAITVGKVRSSATLAIPHGLTFDSSGSLFVSDSQNNRTLMFAPPFSSGMDASLVIGQADFASAVTATTATGLDFPYGVIAASNH